ncbi:MAG TPA: YegS/Rv2252/BmrU family lipid kinase [Candidatus Avoscillospira avistercoris]|uniref:YegS/Rv2252/BmrU family lipid kinase n=1 Tax=Candidatus Avoscillospira avistercoris TaxID=2840707 RepID=A0A9D1F960_9FIRM|nr:YegS/Rv2252/BmrU family lipid kinase [Candidatus Avoscillospira avistercoris]
MQKQMLFFVNPNAGHAEIRTQLMDVVTIFTRGGYDVTVHPTSRSGEIPQVIAAEGHRYDMIVSAGGDGTLNESVTGLMQLSQPPVLGYLPGGTVNDVASTLQLPKNCLEAAKIVVSGRPVSIDVGSINDRWFAYVAAFGAFTDVSYRTAQNDKRILGRMAYLLRGVQAITEIRPIPVTVEVNGQTIQDEVILGLVGSTTSVGGFKARRELEISLTDGLSEIILVRRIKNLVDLNAVAAAILRQDFTGEYFHSFKASEAVISFEDPVAWTLDGEFGGNIRRAEIHNHRQALQIMVPNESFIP